jgi:hypothetical protein
VKGALLAMAAVLCSLAAPQVAVASVPVQGWASEYGPGNGVAMPFCTWTVRHERGCGWARIQSLQTGVTVVVRVVDYCYCLVPGTPHPERIADLQYDVVDALGLRREDGMYQVAVERLGELLPNTSIQ